MKFLKIFAIAAVAVALAVSCGKDKKDTVKLGADKYYDNGSHYTAPENEAGVQELWFFEDGTGLGKRPKPVSQSLQSLHHPRTVKVEYEYKVFTYTVNGTKYTIIGLFDEQATFEYNPETNVVTIETVVEGKPQQIVIEGVEETPALEIDNLVEICRKWKVSAIDIHVEGGDLAEGGISGGQVFRHGNLYEIAKAIKAKGVNFDAEKLIGYNITSINFGQTGTILVQFSGQDPYVGEWNLTTKGFSYDLEYGEGNDILNAHAAGTLTVGGGKLKLDLSGEIKGTKDYTSTISITLVPAN